MSCPTCGQSAGERHRLIPHSTLVGLTGLVENKLNEMDRAASGAMQPLGTRVLLRRPPITEQIGSIHVPEKYRSVPQEGTVVGIGAGVTTVKVGDQVLFGRYNTIPVPGSKDLVLGWERDMMAILEPPNYD